MAAISLKGNCTSFLHPTIFFSVNIECFIHPTILQERTEFTTFFKIKKQGFLSTLMFSFNLLFAWPTTTLYNTSMIAFLIQIEFN